MERKWGVRLAHATGLFALCAMLFGAGPATARDPGTAAGVEVDLLPIATSAAAGKPGGSLQVWAGRDRLRLRLVGADLHLPDAFTPAPFGGRHTTVSAGIIDVFLLEWLRGPWIGAGAEYWWNEIGLRTGSARARWSGPVATVGAGWVFPVWRGLYLNPWGAAHAPLERRTVAVGAERYRPRAVEAEVSLKIGWWWAGPTRAGP